MSTLSDIVADENIILDSINSGVYVSAADLNSDEVVDNADLSVFMSQRCSTSQVAHFIFGDFAEEDYFVTRSPAGLYVIEPDTGSGEILLSNPDGLLVKGLGRTDYLINNTFAQFLYDWLSVAIHYIC